MSKKTRQRSAPEKVRRTAKSKSNTPPSTMAKAQSDSPENNANEVGYGRPPKHSQFKPGQSGNPKGRRPQTKNLKETYEQVLNAPLVISDGGTRTTVTALQATFMQLSRKAVSGDTAATRLLLDQAARLNLLADNKDDNRSTDPLTDLDNEILAEVERGEKWALKRK